ncbi:MAG: VOC family protein [Gammaproteobacteria bacterium]|jgi:predicted enzyme related to lactoylglutathione lyase|nr:VOC family protein [Gammaproteobacteria bacterium]MBT3860491.1 VOC family protein [Gammaproteobacteria bacterium]MBT3987940.1 VOC family protein [Gammaproteobacteria bacterium]MBT4256636.1 VOC family protein [Gammaproteobacteria bacterium]MBT4582467.1 VOC family protein [Gammaproteobacteria bacterium]
MSIEVKKSAIDIGIIAKDIEAMMHFYGEVMGLEFEAAIDMPGGGTMNRFKVGDSVIKLIELDPAAPADAAPGGIRGATGYRYWTITVGNLEACVTKAAEAGAKIVVPAKVVRPGVTIAIIADPDGNWVELLENG